MTIVAEHAGDLISEITLAMTGGLGLSKIGSTIHPHPARGSDPQAWRPVQPNTLDAVEQKNPGRVTAVQRWSLKVVGILLSFDRL